MEENLFKIGKQSNILVNKHKEGSERPGLFHKLPIKVKKVYANY